MGPTCTRHGRMFVVVLKPLELFTVTHHLNMNKLLCISRHICLHNPQQTIRVLLKAPSVEACVSPMSSTTPVCAASRRVNTLIMHSSLRLVGTIGTSTARSRPLLEAPERRQCCPTRSTSQLVHRRVLCQTLSQSRDLQAYQHRSQLSRCRSSSCWAAHRLTRDHQDTRSILVSSWPTRRPWSGRCRCDGLWWAFLRRGHGHR